MLENNKMFVMLHTCEGCGRLSWRFMNSQRKPLCSHFVALFNERALLLALLTSPSRFFVTTCDYACQHMHAHCVWLRPLMTSLQPARQTGESARAKLTSSHSLNVNYKIARSNACRTLCISVILRRAKTYNGNLVW